MASVREIMSTKLVAVGPSASLIEAARAMLGDVQSRARLLVLQRPGAAARRADQGGSAVPEATGAPRS
jgi:CBS domain-containing protein